MNCLLWWTSNLHWSLWFGILEGSLKIECLWVSWVFLVSSAQEKLRKYLHVEKKSQHLNPKPHHFISSLVFLTLSNRLSKRCPLSLSILPRLMAKSDWDWRGAMGVPLEVPAKSICPPPPTRVSGESCALTNPCFFCFQRIEWHSTTSHQELCYLKGKSEVSAVAVV